MLAGLFSEFVTSLEGAVSERHPFSRCSSDRTPSQNHLNQILVGHYQTELPVCDFAMRGVPPLRAAVERLFARCTALELPCLLPGEHPVAKFRCDVRAVEYIHRFPHELQACGSLLFIASSPCIKAMHLPSRSKEIEIKVTRHRCGPVERIVVFSSRN